MDGEKKPTRKRIAMAETAQEFKAKYGKKRFTSANAGQSRILNHIYTALQIEDSIPRSERVPLYDLRAIQGKVDVAKDGNRYVSYARLTEWTVDAYQAAINMRNSLRSVTAHLYQIAATLLCGENLRRTLGETAKEANIWLWLHTLTLEGYTPQDENFYMVKDLRTNIATGLKYMNAYNTLIAMIAAEMKIPEYTVFQVEMKGAIALITAANEALDALREDALLYRIEEAATPEDIAAASAPDATVAEIKDNIGRFTPEFLKETLTAFEPIEVEAEPLQPEAVNAVKERLGSILDSGVYAWTTLFSMLKDGV